MRGSVVQRAMERMSEAEQNLVLIAFMILAVVAMVGCFWYLWSNMR